jgi:hypothetical protein
MYEHSSVVDLLNNSQQRFQRFDRNTKRHDNKLHAVIGPDKRHSLSISRKSLAPTKQLISSLHHTLLQMIRVSHQRKETALDSKQQVMGPRRANLLSAPELSTHSIVREQ